SGQGQVPLEDDTVETGEHGDDQAGKLGDEARQRLHGVLLRTGAGANPILAGGRRPCSTYFVAAMPRWVNLGGVFFKPSKQSDNRFRRYIKLQSIRQGDGAPELRAAGAVSWLPKG